MRNKRMTLEKRLRKYKVNQGNDLMSRWGVKYDYVKALGVRRYLEIEEKIKNEVIRTYVQKRK